ncbi:MAG: serine/threonine protein kinase [Bdellovibrionaceae bacterium]|nr:serine/threonine protein kinase [Pseudobdellovibrionaceae bacterium]MBX3033816.1 serine/threonine protein kinase [Pseudobdellovibrionaceae bacterium]
MSQKHLETTFYQLDPQAVMMAAENAGFEPTGEFLQLNSYENRVFDLSLEDRSHLIAKFYRPGRWSRDTILEEHEFLLDLQAEDITAVAPVRQKDGSTVSLQEGLWTAFFPKVRGRLPDELLDADLVKVGRLLARVHMVGARKPAPHRPTLDTAYHGGWPALTRLEDWIAPEVRTRYIDAAERILEAIEDTFDPAQFQRIHGDLHRGNLLNDGQKFFLVDFDDFVNGPVVQDFWMLLSGDEDRLEDEQNLLLEGYEELLDFPHEQWEWIPLLRGLRILMYSGWIAHRWQDPSFPRLFPDFGSYAYWAKEVEALEKISWDL